MSKMENYFNASQFVIMECIGHFVDLSRELQDANFYSAESMLKSVEDKLPTLTHLIGKMQDLEYEDEDFGNYEDSTSESSDSFDEEEPIDVEQDE